MRKYAVSTHTGYKRTVNEDCYRADHAHGIWLVTDGMGGHDSGEVAAAIAAQHVVDRVAQGASVAQAASESHTAILREIEQRGGSGKGMGTTLVALQIEDQHYKITWIGDSRAYLYDGELKQLTWDHSPVGERLARGEISAEDARTHSERHLLSRALGVSNQVEPKADTIEGELLPGQRILLCSDGLTDDVEQEQLALIMAQHQSPRQQVDALEAAALRAGGKDNITIMVVGDAGEPDEDSEPEATPVPELEPEEQGPPLPVIIASAVMITGAAIAALLLL